MKVVDKYILYALGLLLILGGIKTYNIKGFEGGIYVYAGTYAEIVGVLCVIGGVWVIAKALKY